MKCKNCKHSQKHSYSDTSVAGMLFCNHKLLEATYATPDSDVAARGLVAENDEGWGFMVGPDFGCIHFEELDCD